MSVKGEIQFENNQLDIIGDVLFADVKQLVAQVDNILKTQQVDVTIDLAKLDKYDSAICLLLVHCFRLAQQKRITLNCINIPGSLHNIFKVYDLDQVLPFLEQH